MANKQLNVRVSDDTRLRLSALVDSYGSEGKAVAAAIDLLHATDKSAGPSETEQAYHDKLLGLRRKVCSVLNWAFVPDDPSDTYVIESGIDELGNLCAGLSEALAGQTRPIGDIRAEQERKLDLARAALSTAETTSTTSKPAQIDRSRPYLECDACHFQTQDLPIRRQRCTQIVGKRPCAGNLLIKGDWEQDDYSQA